MIIIGVAWGCAVFVALIGSLVYSAFNPDGTLDTEDADRRS